MRRIALLALLGLGATLRPAASGDPLDALRYGTPEAREDAVDQVLGGKVPQAGPALLDSLDDSKGLFRLKVVRALGVVKDDAAVRPLVALMQDPDAEMRVEAARSLERIADPAAVPGLVSALGDGNEEVREAAVRSLGACGGPAQAAPVAALLKDKNRLVRLAAVDTLGHLGGDTALTALEGQLAENEASFKRHVVIAIGASGGERAEAHLAGWLSDKDPYLRGFAAEALAKRPPDEALTPVLLGLLNDPVYAVRIRAVEVLGAWRSKRAVPALLKTLKADEPTLRWKAVLALGSIGDGAAKEALDYLAQHDAEAEIRAAAGRALKDLK